MTTNTIPSHRRLLLVRRGQVSSGAPGSPRRYGLARLDLGPPPERADEERFTYLKRAYD